MKGVFRKMFLGIIAGAVVFTNVGGFLTVFASTPVTTYELYPSPQNVNYDGTQTTIIETINIVAEDGIDSYTKAKIEEVLAIKGLTLENGKVTYGSDRIEGRMNILLGTYGSKGVADTYFNDRGINSEVHFEKFDAHMLDIKDQTIAILGKDSDATFYGITTLKQIFNQMSGMSIEQMLVKDFADIKNRGFIEGYYGTPWSTEDRISLMKYGGDLKLNQYMFAPKDDLYHNGKWRELYPAEELAEIAKLAKAGNESKNHFVWTIHVFMHKPIRFDSNYEADLNLIKTKFTQLLNVGVRQFGVLADDAGAASSENQIRLLEDLTAWLKEQKKIYPDLNIELPYCPEAYHYFHDMLKTLNKAPENVQLMTTGEATTNNGVWGRVSDTYAKRFMDYIKTEGNPAKKPYFWINWPCIDNTKQRLIMGGNDQFFKPGIDPTNIEGIVINPMMHAEANKSALFATADFAWQVWDDKAEADQNWNDSFKYMDHNTAEETEASTALRELSKHMIKQGQDGRVVELEESVELGPKLSKFLRDYEAGTDIQESGALLLTEFKKIENAATLYLEEGNPDVAREMGAHIKSLRDVAIAGEYHVKAAMALQSDQDYDNAWQYYSQGQSSVEYSKTHTFLWRTSSENYQMVAQAGMQHLVPFNTKLASKLEMELSPVVNPNLQIIKYVTNRTDIPKGSIGNVLDGNDDTGVSYESPNMVYANEYVGITYTKPIELKNVRFVMGGGNNHMNYSKVQYTEDGKQWIDLDGIEHHYPKGGEKVVIAKENLTLDVKVIGVRLIATRNNNHDLYLDIFGIDVNKEATKVAQRYVGTPSYQTSNMNIRDGNVSAISDFNDSTNVDFVKGATYPDTGADRDSIDVDNWVALTLDEAKPIGKVRFLQTGVANAISKGVIEYSVNGTDNWIELDLYSDGRAEYLKDFSALNISAKSIRVRNLEKKKIWWNVSGLDVYEPFIDSSLDDSVDDSTPITYSIIKSSNMKVYAATGPETNLNDKNDETIVEYQTLAGDKALVGDYIGYDLGRKAYIGKIHIIVGGIKRANATGNKWESYRLETSIDNITWTQHGEIMSGAATGKDIIDVNLHGKVARYVRLYNLKSKHAWVGFGEFNVEESDEIGTIKNLYTNIETTATVIAKGNQAKLMNANNITLAKGDYIGIKLDSIKDIHTINSECTQDTLTMETSINELEWSVVSDFTNVNDAKYIRLINHTNAAITVDITKLNVMTNEISAPTLVSSTIKKDDNYGSQDSRNNGAAFDKKIGTNTTFAGLPKQDDTILYDLGSLRDIQRVALYVTDNEKNFIRDAKIELATEVDGEYTQIATIGDGVANTEEGDAAMTALYSGLYVSDGKYPNYVSIQTSDLNLKGRYLRITFTAPNNNRFVSINEIEINNAAYIPTENDRSLIVDPIEVEGYAPSNMIDGNLSTAYKPNTNNDTIKKGFILYRLSKHTDTRKINIIQNGSTISKAKVSIRGSNDDGETTTWKEIGALDKSFNEFVNYHFKNIFEVKIEWESIAPIIQEIILVEEYTIIAGNSELLESKLNEVKPVYEANKDSYTTSTKKALKDALDDAENVISMYIKTQDLIDKTLVELQEAYTNIIVRAENTEALEKEYDTLKLLDESLYLSNGYTEFVKALLHAQEVIEDLDDCTQEQVDKALEDLQAKSRVLVEKAKVEALRNRISDEKVMYLQSDYTQDSFVALQQVWITSEAMLASIDTISNALLASATTSLDNAVQALIDIRPLKNAISIAEDTLGETAYTANSWNAYITLLSEAKAVLANASATEIELNQAVANCVEAKNLLVIDLMPALEATIKKADAIKNDDVRYAKASFEHLQTVMKDAQAYVNDSILHNDDSTKAKLAALEEAIQGLVDLQELRALIVEVKKIEPATDYTKASWSALQEALQLAETEISNDTTTKENIQTQIKELTKVKNELVSIRELSAAVAESEAIKKELYTTTSYNVFSLVLSDVKTVLLNEAATALQVSDAIKALNDARLRLVEKADKDALQKSIDEAKTFDLDIERYTSESYTRFKSVLDEAIALMSKEDATLSESTSMIMKLNIAIEELVMHIRLQDNKTNIKVSGTTVQLPENTILSVEQLLDEKQLSQVTAMLPKLTNKVTAYDIKFLLDGQIIQPNGRIELSLPIPSDYDRARLALYRFHDDKVEEMPFRIEQDTMIVQSDAFSIYAIVEIKLQDADIQPEIPEVKPSIPSENTTPNTGDTSTLPSLYLLFTISAGFLLFMKKCRKA